MRKLYQLKDLLEMLPCLYGLSDGVGGKISAIMLKLKKNYGKQLIFVPEKY